MENGSVGPCEWCLTFSGRLMKGRACCELRMLATIPKARRQEVYNRVRREDGQSAVDQMVKDVAAEYKRRQAFDAAKREVLTGPAKAALLRP